MATKAEDDDDALIQQRLSFESSSFDVGEIAEQENQQPTNQARPPSYQTRQQQQQQQQKQQSQAAVNSFQRTFKRFIGNLTSGPGEKKMTKKERNEIIAGVTAGPLPQRFLVKYVGSRSCEGLWGTKVTRVPVDLMIRDLRKLNANDDLPLLNVKIQEDGFKVSLHPKSRSSMKVKDVGLIPLEFISYAVQDGRYSKVFVFILVREMSSTSRVTECHGYLCDSIVTCRKMALATADAFGRLEANMKGEKHQFRVDLKAADGEITEI